ncbi:glycosyltransferase family 4 protein [Francisellaceae bacterium]|nr:glycosyltransferase family 4 protein [Francisellaceae bacterium]
MKILYILSSYNIYGGTPKKTLNFLEYYKSKSSLYVFSDSGKHNYKHLFEKTGANIYEGNHGRNIFRHVYSLLKIIKLEGIDIIQTQFFFGELIGFFIKLLRPEIKLVVAFVGPFPPAGTKLFFSKQIYKKVDAVVYVSKYVKYEKEKQFPSLGFIKSKVIYNGVPIRTIAPKSHADSYVRLISVSGLVGWKNILVLFETLVILKQVLKTVNIELYVLGDGPERQNLERYVLENRLEKNVFLLGYCTDVQTMLDQADIYVHPAYSEGFGIAVAEAMAAGKPIIVANAGALPELIENGVSGLVVDPFDSEAWAEAIIKLLEDENYARELGKQAKLRAENKFSVKQFVLNYEKLYQQLLGV